MARSSSARWDAGAEVAQLVDRLAATRKYRMIHRDTLRAVAEIEAARVRDPKMLEQLVRQRLHRSVAHYLAPSGTVKLIRQVSAASTDLSDPDLRAWCSAAMAEHVSTAERLVALDDFYGQLIELIGPVASVADLACAYNVLSLPWLRDVSSVPYVGYDFNADHVALGQAFLARVDPTSHVVHADILVQPALVSEAAALLLKTFHCLEGRQKGSGIRLIEVLPTPIVVISLPTRSRGGRRFGFAAGHGETIEAKAAEQGWAIARRELVNEELWAIDKDPVR